MGKSRSEEGSAYDQWGSARTDVAEDAPEGRHDYGGLFQSSEVLSGGL